MFTLEVEKAFKALQGLKSPIRDTQGLPSLQPQAGYDLLLKVGITFKEAQLNDRGWFVDSDAVDTELERIITYLASKPWTEQFDFRPTFEQVARWAFTELSSNVPQLSYITICNRTLGTNTTYQKEEI